VRTGLNDPEPNNGEPEELADWIAAGFKAEEAEVWRQWRISIATATAWRTAGVDDGLRAAQWWIAGHS
jgi:hypothetical protein